MSAGIVADLTQPPHAGLAAEILAGAGLSLAQAARKIPSFRSGRPTAPSTIYRWMTDGVRLPDGRVLRLESARVAGRWLTTEPALARFISAQTPRPDTGTGAPPCSARPRSHAADRAATELDALGI